MKTRNDAWSTWWAVFVVVLASCLLAGPALAEGYGNALKGVERYDVVFEVTQGNPKIDNLIFWAVRNAYQAPEVKSLPNQAQVAVVFHGQAVKSLSSNRAPFNGAEWGEVEKFQQTLREMKKNGVKLEVCAYALKVFGVDPKTVIPEIDLVDNGFVSVIGYQMQGYAVVRIP